MSESDDEVRLKLFNFAADVFSKPVQGFKDGERGLRIRWHTVFIFDFVLITSDDRTAFDAAIVDVFIGRCLRLQKSLTFYWQSCDLLNRVIPIIHLLYDMCFHGRNADLHPMIDMIADKIPEYTRSKSSGKWSTSNE